MERGDCADCAAAARAIASLVSLVHKAIIQADSVLCQVMVTTLSIITLSGHSSEISRSYPQRRTSLSSHILFLLL